MIRFEAVCKSFGGRKILENFNLDIEQGQIFVILGRSGTGKSVALKHLVGLLKPDSGKIFLDGIALNPLSEREFMSVRRKCGIVFQLPALLDSRNLFENLTLGIRELPMTQKIARVQKMLSEVQLDYLQPLLFKRTPHNLSYGEQKRVSLARTLLSNPDYVLYDEPTTGLDPVTARVIHELIRKVSRDLNKTSVLVSHDMRNALRIADRLAILSEGRIVDQGSPDEILRSKNVVTAEFLAGIHGGSHG